MEENRNSIYGEHLPKLQQIMMDINERIDELRENMKEQHGMDPVEHCLSRIKSEESMREKCRRKSLPETTESALFHIQDAIGFRIVCAFVSDVYMIRDYLTGIDSLKVIKEKDYIRQAKSNGYRSYHMILQTEEGYYIEVQLRTISMDTWAALEHHLKYKKQVSGNEALIVRELKRCADELASTDVSMQIIRDMIFDEETSF